MEMTARGDSGSVTFDGHTLTIRRSGVADLAVGLEHIGSISIEKAGKGVRNIRFAIDSDSETTPNRAFGADESTLVGLAFAKEHLRDFEQLITAIEHARHVRRTG